MSARTYVSGHCGPDRSPESHGRCTGQYAGTVCVCRCGHQTDAAPAARPVQRRRLLDLYSSAGGAARGYQLAGFEVIGVDLHPQPHYAGDHFIQADALTYLADHAGEYDAIHASPTCQTWARVTAWRGARDNHPDLLTPTLAALAAQSVPWVVENVPEAAAAGILRADYLLCGTQFGLSVRRHRVFQVGNWSAYELIQPCSCYRNPSLLPFEHKGERAFADALGCEWMTNREARQAVPPAYTEYIGQHLHAVVASLGAAA